LDLNIKNNLYLMGAGSSKKEYPETKN